MGEERQGAKGHCLDGAEAHAAWRQRNIGLVQAFGHFSGVNNGSWKICWSRRSSDSRRVLIPSVESNNHSVAMTRKRRAPSREKYICVMPQFSPIC